MTIASTHRCCDQSFRIIVLRTPPVQLLLLLGDKKKPARANKPATVAS